MSKFKEGDRVKIIKEIRRISPHLRGATGFLVYKKTNGDWVMYLDSAINNSNALLINEDKIILQGT